MPDFGAYIGWNEAGDLEEWYREWDRADSVAFIIGHGGISLTLYRSGTALAAQNALLVPAGRMSEARVSKVESGAAAHEQLLIVGAADMNIQRGDQFKYPSTTARLNYRVVRVERAVRGMVQGFCEEVQ